MKELIDKFLNEQTTPDEERRLSQQLRQEYDVEAWLAEDETAVYDHIVSQRTAKRRLLRWAVAACLVLAMAAGALVLMPSPLPSARSGQPVRTARTASPNGADYQSERRGLEDRTALSTHEPAPKRVRAVARPTASTADSLQYYIARLEQELDNVTDSGTYAARAEQVIRADARLQRLVQRIMMGELTRTDQPIEAMNTNPNQEEEQPWTEND